MILSSKYILILLTYFLYIFKLTICNNCKKQNFNEYTQIKTKFKIKPKNKTLKIEKNPLITLIIPVYNKQRYIKYSLDSLIVQNLKDIEVIIIDDGSTDKSKEICKKYAKKYKFKLIVQKNKGVSAARNKGIDIAKGKWITFMDADDTYKKNYFDIMKKAIDKAEKEKIDVINSNLYRCKNDLKMKIIKWKKKTFIHPAVYTKFFRKSMLDKYKMRFDTRINKAEDLIFTYVIFAICRKILNINYRGYYYRKKRNSNSLSKQPYIWTAPKAYNAAIRKLRKFKNTKRTINLFEKKKSTAYKLIRMQKRRLKKLKNNNKSKKNKK